MKLGRFVFAGLLCLLLFASPVTLAATSTAHENQAGPTQLLLGLEGAITGAGNQHYELNGGQLLSGTVDNQPVSPGKVSFDIDADVIGLTVSGHGTLQLPSGFQARITINDAVPAAYFPIGCDPTVMGACDSEIPLVFTGMASVQTGKGDPMQLPIGIESAYWDPLGLSIVLTSLNTVGFTFSLVVSYNTATISWTGVQLDGGFAGSLGSEPVEGLYHQVTYSQENLLKGTESDFGSIAFYGASDTTLDGQGFFFGHTSFTLAEEEPCSAVFPTGSPIFDLPPSILSHCIATGATSNGVFFMAGGHGSFIFGTYNTVWTVPSIGTATTVIASVF